MPIAWHPRVKPTGLHSDSDRAATATVELPQPWTLEVRIGKQASPDTGFSYPAVMAYLLTWNGDATRFDYHRDLIQRTERFESVPDWWSVRDSTPLDPGARVFLLQQNTYKGVIAHGHLTNGLTTPHDGWFMVDLWWDAVVSTPNRLPREALMNADPNGPWKQARFSGARLSLDQTHLLERLWQQRLRALGR